MVTFCNRQKSKQKKKKQAMDQGKSMSHNRDITTGHQTPSEGISVKIFSADTGKYLDQQVYKYIAKNKCSTTQRDSPKKNILTSNSFNLLEKEVAAATTLS